MIHDLFVIETIPELNALAGYLSDKEFIAFDVETTGLSQQDQIVGMSLCAEDNKAYYIVLNKWSKENEQLEPTPAWARIIDFTKSLMGKSLIGHNALFDCMMIESNYKIKLIDSIHTDTLILAHLLNENRRVGLKELAAEMYGEDATDEAKAMQASVLANGGVWSATEKEMYKADSAILGKYGAKDAWLTYKLFFDLVVELEEQGLTKFFYEDESMPLLRGPTYQLNTTGIRIDQKALSQLKATLIAECAEAKAFIETEITPHIKDKYPGTSKKTTFNIGASQQLSWLLFGQLGLEFGTLTKGGKTICRELGLKPPYTAVAKREFLRVCQARAGEIYASAALINGKKRVTKKIKAPWAYLAADKAILKKLAPKLKWVAKLLEYNQKIKLLSTYVEGIEERIQYGVLRSSYLQHGTKTGRYASRNPNLQNLPRDDQRVKGCFIARPGKVFVSADFSQLEPRTFAYYSQDPRLMAAFDGSSDFYSVVGMEVYDKYDCTPQKDGSTEAFGVKYKKLRDNSKVIALASAYGATPPQLARTTGKSIEETKQDMENYFERFHGVRKMMLEAHDIVKLTGQVTNLFGRIRRIPDAKKIKKMYGDQEHWDLPYDARKLLNMACNFRIQSTGASIVNRAAIKFHELSHNLNLDTKTVSQIHDEIVIECNEQDAETVSVLLQDAMENTTILEGVPLEAKPRVTKTLAK